MCNHLLLFGECNVSLQRWTIQLGATPPSLPLAILSIRYSLQAPVRCHWSIVRFAAARCSVQSLIKLVRWGHKPRALVWHMLVRTPWNQMDPFANHHSCLGSLLSSSWNERGFLGYFHDIQVSLPVLKSFSLFPKWKLLKELQDKCRLRGSPS